MQCQYCSQSSVLCKHAQQALQAATTYAHGAVRPGRQAHTQWKQLENNSIAVSCAVAFDRQNNSQLVDACLPLLRLLVSLASLQGHSGLQVHISVDVAQANAC